MAEEFATEVLNFNSQQRMARIVLGLKDFRARRYGEARKNLEQAAYTPVGELTSWLLIAWSYAGEGELNQALKALDRLDSNESFANFKAFHAGLIADYLGNAIRAEASYRKAYEEAGIIAPRRPGLWQFPGAQRPRRRGPEDLPQLPRQRREPAGPGGPRQSLKNVKPQPFIASPGAGAAEALFSLATSMTDEQSIDVALLYTRLALSFDSDKPVMYTLLGDTYEDMKRFDKAIDAYAPGARGFAAPLQRRHGDRRQPAAPRAQGRGAGQAQAAHRARAGEL